MTAAGDAFDNGVDVVVDRAGLADEFGTVVFTMSRVTGIPVRRLVAASFLTIPSMVRTLEWILSARKESTSGGISRFRYSAFVLRMASLSSRSGGWMSARRPCSKRERIRSSRMVSSCGGRSDVMIICL